MSEVVLNWLPVVLIVALQAHLIMKGLRYKRDREQNNE
jgi:hypothetical protein